MSDADFAGKTAIVGIGASDFRALYRDPDPERTREQIAIEAIRDALADAGLERDQIDGLVTGGTDHYEPLGYRAGLTDVRYIADYPSAGRMCPSALMNASMAVVHGLANYVVLFNSVAFRSRQVKFGMASGGWVGKRGCGTE